MVSNTGAFVSVEDLIRSQGFGQDKPPGKRVLKMAEQAVDRAMELADLKFRYRRLPIKHTGNGVVEVPSYGTRLNIGTYAYLLDPAVEVVVYLTTLGSSLDREVEKLNKKGKPAEAYWLNCAGVLALNAGYEKVRDLTEKMARHEGWGVGLNISPGTLIGWPLSDQKNLCSLLDYKSLGISITGSSLLVPYKSNSGLIGLGPEYTSTKVGLSCKYCTSAESCWVSKIKNKPYPAACNS